MICLPRSIYAVMYRLFRLQRWMLRMVLLLISVTAFCPELKSQAAFERSAAGIEILSGITETKLNDYWDPGPGLGLYWTTTFYLGEIDIRAGYRQILANQPDIPDITNILTTLGWSLPVALTENLNLSAGLLIGNNFMYRTAAGPLDMPESEFTAGLRGSLGYRVSDSLSLRAGIQQIRVFTFHRIDLTSAGIALQYHFNTPESLVRFLQ